MDRKTLKIALLGAGRMGGALHRTLSRAGFSSSLASRPKNPQASQAILENFSAADVIFLTLPDAQIGVAAQQYAEAFHSGQIVAHCAGALTLAPLEHAAAQGANIGSMHPLCAIASPETSLIGIHAALAGDETARLRLGWIARAIGMTPFEVNEEDRGRYHAAAALAANGMMALAAQSSELMALCGMTSKQALGAILPLMRSSLVALEHKGLPGALTGPIARGDIEVVERHLNALRHPEDRTYRATYIDLARTLSCLAKALGEVSSDSIRAIDELLATAPPEDCPRGERP